MLNYLEIHRVTENIGTNMGLSGCIRRLKVGRKVVELEEGRDWMVERTHEVRECGSNPCASLPCLNTATCLQTGLANFTCTCSPHYTGIYNYNVYYHKTAVAAISFQGPLYNIVKGSCFDKKNTQSDDRLN